MSSDPRGCDPVGRDPAGHGPDARGPRRRLYRLGLRRPDPADQVQWEIEHYLAERTEQLVREGWDPEEARREAERRFGAVERYGSRLTRIDRRKRMKTTMGSMGGVIVDGLVDVVRTFRRSPGFALGVVLTLGLGIGANAAMFGIVDRLLLRAPDHIVEPERVRRVGVTRTSSSFGTWTQQSMTYPDLLDLEEAGGLDAAGFSHSGDYTVGSGPDAYSLTGRMVTDDFFPLLGVRPTLGRFFSPDEDRIGAQGTVVLSHELWTNRFGRDPEVIGRTLTIGGAPYTAIGVAPEGFTGVELEPVDLWLPVEAARGLQNPDSHEWRSSRSWWWIRIVARVADHATVEAAAEEATALHRAGRADLIEQDRYNADARLDLLPLVAAGETRAGKVAKWLMGVAFAVLLIACANVANLLLARGARRRKESAVRLALGVKRSRLVIQRSVEAVALALVGGVVALFLAHQGGSALAAVLLPDVLFPSAVTWRTVGFTVAICVVAGALAGVGPALQGSRVELAEVLSDQARGSSSRKSLGRSLLAVAQAGLSVLLLVGAGLFIQSVREVESLDLGLEVDQLALARLELADDDLSTAEQNELYRQAVDRARQLPTVRSASLTHSPFQWAFGSSIRVPGLDSIPRMPGGGPYHYGVDSNYFRTVGLDVVQGRGIQESDGEGAQKVAVVTRTMADSLWNGSPVGECLLVGRDAEECTTVVGVVEDASRGSLETDPYFAYYLHIDQMDRPARALYVRVDGDPADVAADVALALRSFSPGVRFARVQPLREILDPQSRAWTMGATMFTVFGVLALVVAVVGLYSLLAFNVAQRTRELGIRTALGASRTALLSDVVFRGVKLVAVGVALGVVGAWVIGPRVQDLLFQVSPRNPAILAGVAVLLLVVATAASFIPGLRATRIDPMEALSTE